MKSAELDAQAARFNATFRSVLATTHLGETVTVDAKTPSFKTSRLVHRSIKRISLSLKNIKPEMGRVQVKTANLPGISQGETSRDTDPSRRPSCSKRNVPWLGRHAPKIPEVKRSCSCVEGWRGAESVAPKREMDPSTGPHYSADLNRLESFRFISMTGSQECSASRSTIPAGQPGLPCAQPCPPAQKPKILYRRREVHRLHLSNLAPAVSTSETPAIRPCLPFPMQPFRNRVIVCLPDGWGTRRKSICTRTLEARSTFAVLEGDTFEFD